MRSVGRAALALASSTCLALAAACVLYPTSLLEMVSLDAGSDAEVDTCVHAVPPEAGLVNDAPGVSENYDLVLVDSRLDVSDFVRDGGLGPAIGFDLDGVCACEGRAACAYDGGTNGTRCAPNGRNNVFGTAAGFFAGDPSTPEPFAPAGEAANLFRLEGYNGTPNDPQVILRYYASLGSDSRQPADAGVMRRVPAQDGNDIWTIEPGSVVDGANKIGVSCEAPGLPTCLSLPSNTDLAAYVVDGTLVARPAGPMRVMFPFAYQREAFITVDAAVMTGRLGKNSAGKLELHDGMLGGRVATDTMLAVSARGPNLLAVMPGQRPPAVCESPDIFALLREQVCRLPDLPANPAADGRGETPCGAISFGLAFRAIEAKRGRVFTPPRPDTCPAGFEAGVCP